MLTIWDGEMSGFHGSEIKTPCPERFGSRRSCTDQFSEAPISTPTRAGLMTGRYPNRLPIPAYSRYSALA
ncbi:hypothetical protein NXW89_00155 [Bacteroides thetaiotaomicron]|nr:hypothetical protein [Bacteroides thetaiotaomicron]